jgi:hypothetical protein
LLTFLSRPEAEANNWQAEQAIRPLVTGCRNWLHVRGDGGLWPAALLLSVVTSVRRHGVNSCASLKHILAELPARSMGTDLTDLLPDVWDRSRAGPMAVFD